MSAPRPAIALPLEVPVRLVPAVAPPPAPRPAPAALYVEGADPARWLRAAREAGLPLAQTLALPVALSSRDRTPRGALLLPPEGTAPRRTPLALACRARLGRLFLPEDAALAPEPTDAELEALLVPAVALLLPRGVFAGAARADLAPLLSLVRAPSWTFEDWSGARAGDAPPRRVSAVGPLDPPDAAAALAAGQGEIGSRPPEKIPEGPKKRGAPPPDERKESAPPESTSAPPEPTALPESTSAQPEGSGAEGAAESKGLGGALGSLWRALSDAARALAGGLGAGAPEDPALGNKREAALERLLRLLDEDPEEGLRYALPIGGRKGAAPRGAAPPAGALSRRDDPSFDLSRVRGEGGRPADPWAAPAKTVEELRRRYRDLAARELALGRHRRAAYILAELLHDLEGAAAALRAGRHFREAAAVYKDLLRRPEAAAECLEAGGHLPEAAALYEEERRFERAGDLRARLGDAAAAEVLYRKAAVACEESRAFLSAARIYEGKLQRPDLALSALDRGSLDPHQTALCLGERFRIMGKLERHDQALLEVAELRDARPSPYRAQALVEAFAGIGERYPDLRVRGTAFDAARVLVGRRVEDASGGAAEAEALLAIVVRASPKDKLLLRDARRFIDERKRREAQAAKEARSSLFVAARGLGDVGRRFEIVRRFSLPSRVRWTDAVATGEGFVAVGRHGDKGDGPLVLAHFGEDGKVDGAVYDPKGPAASSEAPLLAALEGPHGVRVVVADPGGAPFPASRLSRRLDAPAVDASTPDWLPPDAVGIGTGRGVFHVVRRGEDELLLATFTSSGDALSLVRIAGADELRGEGAPLPTRYPVLATPDGVLVGAGGWLYLLRDPLWREDRKAVEIPFPVRSIVAAQSPGMRGLVVTHAEGSSLLVSKNGYRIDALLAPEMPSPLAAITGEGALGIISLEGGPIRLYAIEGRPPRFAGEARLGPALAPVALMAGSRPTDLVLVDAGGQVLVVRASVAGG